MPADIIASTGNSGSSVAAELASVRKSLTKTGPSTLGSSDALTDALRLVTQRTLPQHHYDQLALLLTLFRQLRDSFSKSLGEQRSGLDTAIHHFLAPSLLPGQPIADLIVTNLESGSKPNQLRAADAAAALSRLAGDLVQSHGTIQLDLGPVLKDTMGQGLRTKPTLILVGHLVKAVPVRDVPDDLLDQMIADMQIAEMGNLKADIILVLLKNRRDAGLYDSDDSMLKPLLPLFEQSLDSSSLQSNLIRYLLPALFKQYPSTAKAILRQLDSPSVGTESGRDLLASWISVAALGVSHGIVSISDLPEQPLQDALCHEDADVRRHAYEMITGGGDEQLLRPEIMKLVKQAFRMNAILSDAGLKQADLLHRRNCRKAGIEVIPSDRGHVPGESLAGFEAWLFDEIVDQGLRNNRRIPISKALLALGIFELYLTILAESETTRQAVFSKDRVALLIACQASDYTEVRTRARSVHAPVPLPGYASLSNPSTQTLLESAYKSFSNPRKTQNEAAVAALVIAFERIICAGGGAADGVNFVLALLARAEDEITKAEEGLTTGMDDLAVHGLLASIKALVGCLDLSTIEAQTEWKSILQQAVTLSHRVWALTRTVMSLSSALDGEEEEEGPAHEIAKAYQVLDADQGDGKSGHQDVRKVISACWRATKEAAELLSVIVSQPLLAGGDGQICSRKADIDGVGRSFLTWLHEIRHRGTFSKVSEAFARLVDAVKQASLNDLAEQWLNLELQAITQDTLSTTRRSAALPYSILAIVSGDQTLLDKAIDRLITLAEISNTATSDVTRIHCFNILKIVLLDAKQSKSLSRYLERTVMTAVEAFASPNWNVRNVGLILFSTLVHRSLATSAKGGQDLYRSRATLATRHTVAAWHARYPRILPYIVTCLRSLSGGSLAGSRDSSPHSAMFPMLIIIRSLRWSEKEQELQAGLREAVRLFLSNRDHQVRRVAAQALSSLVSSAEAIHEALSISADPRDLNACHGGLQYLMCLMAYAIEWSALDDRVMSDLEQLILGYLRSAAAQSCPPVLGSALACASTLTRQTTTSKDFQRGISSVAAKLAEAPRVAVPGADNMLWGACGILLSGSPDERTLLTLLNRKAEQDRLAVLWQLPDLSASLTRAVFDKVLNMAMSRASGDAVQIVALNSVASTWTPVQWSSEILDQVSERDRWMTVESFAQLLDAKIVPIREAAAPALAWSLVWAMKLEGDLSRIRNVVGILADYLLKYSHEDQSKPSRESVTQALQHFQPYLFSYSGTSQSPFTPKSFLLLQQILLRQMQDDDGIIRVKACGMVCKGLNLTRPVCQIRAVERWWSWVEQFVPEASGEDRVLWTTWLADLVVDKAGLDADGSIVDSHFSLAEVAFSAQYLFAVEKQNLFRDPLTDASYAATVLGRLVRQSNPDVIPQATRTTLECAVTSIEGKEGLLDGADISPIEDVFQAKSVLALRKSFIRQALTT